MTWFQHATAQYSTGQLVLIPLALGTMLALAVMWVHDLVADRRWRHRWEQTLADCAYRPQPYDQEEAK